MSSIYKKGRDGYFYYQTYVFNDKTGKKNKRIFHALGTRDIQKAKEKQKELDDKYQNLNQIKEKVSFYSNLYKYRFKILLMIFVLSTIGIFSKTNQSIKPTDEVEQISEVKNLDKIDTIENDIMNLKNGAVSDNIDTSAKAMNAVDVILEKNINIISAELQIPTYKIERIEQLPGNFEQGKIYLTIGQNATGEEMILLCQDLMKKYEKFTNIIICLYADSKIGKDLANGKNLNLNKIEAQRNWLGMFSYNIVEGQYFDDNPGDYLGTFNK